MEIVSERVVSEGMTLEHELECSLKAKYANIWGGGSGREA